MPKPQIRTVSQRSHLPARAEPYWHLIERGLSLGYRKTAEGGAWLARRYDPKTRRHHERRLGTADDGRKADGAEVLTFDQAQRLATSEAWERAMKAAGHLYTVKDAVDNYLAAQRQGTQHKPTAVDRTEAMFRAYVLPVLGGRKVSELTRDDFAKWKTWAIDRPRGHRAKTKPIPKKRKFRKPRPTKQAVAQPPVDAQEVLRKRRSTVNRVIGALKACLNYAHKSQPEKVADASAWSQLQKFRSADGARLRWLSVDEAVKLQNACAPDFRYLVRAGLLTGCRLGELLALRVKDINSHDKTAYLANPKSGKPRHVPLRDDALELFEGLSANKHADALVFTRADGSPWYRMAITREMAAANAGANIDPPVTFHHLRHTYATLLIKAEVPLFNVAKALGHESTRMVEKHYGHLEVTHHIKLIHAALPQFGETTHNRG